MRNSPAVVEALLIKHNSNFKLYNGSDAKQKKSTFVFLIIFFYLNHRPKKTFLFFIFYNLKKLKDISILSSASSVIHIIYCIIQAVKHYMNCIYIDSVSNNLMIFINKI